MGTADRRELDMRCPPDPTRPRRWGAATPRARTAVVALVALGAASAVTGWPAPAAAQQPAAPEHASAMGDGAFADALWWSIGGGGGSVRLTCDICAADRDAGLTVHLALGARAREDLDVGLELGAWTREDGNVRETARRIDLRAILRPWAGSGFHVIGGLGWIGYSADELGYDSVALSAGAGWDFPLSGRWRIGNRLLLDAASYGSFSNDQGVAASDVSLSIARLEVVLVRR